MSDDNKTEKPATVGHKPTEDEIADTLTDCRNNNWESVLKRVKENPRLAVTKLHMENHIVTTIIHQAITAKGDTEQRAKLILHILDTTPRAAGIPNGYASYPLHSIAQRNTKMDAKTKEHLILALLDAHPDALNKQNNQGQRTPLHVLFTDYISPELTKAMIDKCPEACFIKDKKGYLPAHIACSRHCSPDKLHMLMAINPQALQETTNDGDSLLSLAKSTATISHPNKTLIDALETLMGINNKKDGPKRRRVTDSLTPLKIRMAISSSSPDCPSILRSMPMTDKKAPKRGTRGRARRFTFDQVTQTTIANTISEEDLTVDEVDDPANQYYHAGSKRVSTLDDEPYPFGNRPIKKRKTTLEQTIQDVPSFDQESGIDDSKDPGDDTTADDDGSATANLLLNLSARPTGTDQAAAEVLTQIAQV